MTFDLRQHIREILASTTEENLDSLTEMIFNRTPRKDTRNAYRQALTEIVRKEIASAPRPFTDSRLDQMRDDNQTAYIEPGTDSAGEGQFAADTQTGDTLPSGNVRNSRAARLRLNRFRVTVWIGDKMYRNLLDCTVENLLHAAEESHRQSEANAAAERKYRRLLKVMAERGVQIVGELSDSEIEEALKDDDA